jgi:hypothetical protein
MPVSIIPEEPRIGVAVQIPTIRTGDFDASLAAPERPCPAPKGTASERIGKIAWCWNRQYPGYVAYRAKYDMAANDREIDVGFKLAELMSEEYARLRCWYGDPAYGSWPESAKSERPVKQLVLALMRGEAELLSERPILRKSAVAEVVREEEAA